MLNRSLLILAMVIAWLLPVTASAQYYRACTNCVPQTVVQQPTVIQQSIMQPVSQTIVQPLTCDTCQKYHECMDNLAACQATILDQEHEIEKLRKERHALQHEKDRLEQELAAVIKERDDLTETNEDLIHEQEHLQAQIDELRDGKQELQTNLARTEENLAAASTLLGWFRTGFWIAVVTTVLLFLVTLWLLSKLAGLKRDLRQSDQTVRQLDSSLHEARTTATMAQSRVGMLEQDVIRWQSKYEQCARDAAVSKERIIGTAHAHAHGHGCCDNSSPYNPIVFGPSREGESPIAQVPQSLTPQAPQSTNPQSPQSPNPQAPQSQTPQAPQSLNPQSPQAQAPQAPQALTPQAPQALTPQAPQAQIPQTPQALTPQAPQALAPQAPQALAPQAPQALAPQAPQAQSPQTDQKNESQNENTDVPD